MRGILVLAGLITGTIGALLGAPSALAISPYDGLIQNTDVLIYRDHNGNETDLTDHETLMAFVQDRCSVDDHLMLSAAMVNGKYSITYHPTSTGMQYINLNYIPNKSDPSEYPVGNFNGSGGQQALTLDKGVYQLSLRSDFGGCLPNHGYAQHITYVGNLIFKNTFDINYPTDYEGQVPNGSSGGGQPLDEKPQIRMDTLVDWKASFSEQRFYSYDMPPFTCGDGFPPRMTIELWDKTKNVLILTEEVSSNSKLDYDFEKIYALKEYEIVSWFNCTDGTEFVQPGASFYAFSITEKGVLGENVNMDNCLQQEYPFITWDGCTAMISRVTNALSFGTIKTGTGFEFSEQCRSLGTIGDWLGLVGENRVVCPVVPQNIRNIITPFITFAIGMMTVRFISKKTGSSL